MSRLLHISRASAARAIKKNGIRGRPWTLPSSKSPVSLAHAVFLMPVLESFAATHQWVRELRSWHGERAVAVHVMLPKTEPVYVGRFSQRHELRPLGDAIGWVRKHPLGAEIVLPRAVSSKEVIRVRESTQLVGWVEDPESRTHYDCVCQMCLPSGRPDLQRRVRAVVALCRAKIRVAKDEAALVDAMQCLDTPLERARGEISPRFLMAHTRSESAAVRCVVASLFARFRPLEVAPALSRLSVDPSLRVREAAVDAMVRGLGVKRAGAALEDAPAATLVVLLEQLYLVRDTREAGRILLKSLVRNDEEVTSAARRAARSLLADDELPRDVRLDLEALSL